MTEPNCRGMDTDLFYDDWAQARAVCIGCPVMLQCRMEFLGDPFAYAGGMTPAERNNWRLNQGRPKRPSGDTTPVSEQTRAEVCRLYGEEDYGYNRISTELGVSRTSVRRIVMAAGLHRPPEQRAKLARKQRTDGEDTRRMTKKLLAEGYTVAQIAQMLGRDRSTIYNAKRNLESS